MAHGPYPHGLSTDRAVTPTREPSTFHYHYTSGFLTDEDRDLLRRQIAVLEQMTAQLARIEAILSKIETATETTADLDLQWAAEQEIEEQESRRIYMLSSSDRTTTVQPQRFLVIDEEAHMPLEEPYANADREDGYDASVYFLDGPREVLDPIRAGETLFSQDRDPGDECDCGK